MLSKKLFVGVALGLCGFVSSLAAAAPASEAASRYLERNEAALGLAGVTLRPAGPDRSWRGHRVVRFQQELDGLPVFGRGAVVRLDGTGRVDTVVTFTAPASLLADVFPYPVADASEALQEVTALWDEDRLGNPAAVLGVLHHEGRMLLVWRIDGNTPSGRVRGFVDAVSGAVVRTFSLARHAPGRVYLENPTATPTPVVVELENLTSDASKLEGRAGTVYHFVSGRVNDPQSLVLDQLATDDGSGFLYDPFPDEVVFDDPFAEVNLYYHIDRIDSYFRDQHGHVPFRRMVVVANYTESPGEPFHNAFSTQLGLTSHGLFFGQGPYGDFGYDGDVAYHEFGHFVIDEVAHVGYTDHLFDEIGMHFGPGGIHEGLADYFSATLTDDSLAAEYALGNRARNLDNTSRCPDDVVGEPHDDGWIIGGTAWEIRETLGASRLADSLIFGALTLLSESPTFQDFSGAVMQTAATMRDDGDLDQQEVDTIEGILESRGLTVCGRFLPLDGGAEYTTHPFGFDWIASLLDSDCETLRVVGIWVPSAFQYTIQVPTDARTLSIRIQQSPAEGLMYRVLVRRAEPVGFKVVPLYAELSIVLEQDYDYDLGAFEDAERTVSIHTEMDPPLQPGHTYYVSFLQQNCPDVEMTLSGRTSTELPRPDGGLDGTDFTAVGRGGCDCAFQTPSRPLEPLTLLLLLIVALLAYRRKV